ncbi:hypothetical protein FPZ42_00445 [Mucilaginibacter achroorhodeus]|uniref:Uncharacterized protein n=1 Tax=Mucilaginibacter achroorhodeus TaxID=2599294 RepID=A0A563U8M5_9SPHI|nr:hypothetical protein [Mucilaginibacter achroorhodeus]TWR27717.1 hypothetical protein FPZ42_00445 [Mucilaginibacter achroorhodeus]
MEIPIIYINNTRLSLVMRVIDRAFYNVPYGINPCNYGPCAALLAVFATESYRYVDKPLHLA